MQLLPENTVFGHFGVIELSQVILENGAVVAIIILRKAPLKYHLLDGVKIDADDKTKIDAVYAWDAGKWEHVDNFIGTDCVDFNEAAERYENIAGHVRALAAR